MSRNTIWMKKAAFVAYIIPSESEWKDVRSGETGLPSRVREPIFIRIRLDFGPPFFPRWTTQVIEPIKQPYTFFFSPTLFPHAHFFPIPRYWQPREDWRQASQALLEHKSSKWTKDNIKVIQRQQQKQCLWDAVSLAMSRCPCSWHSGTQQTRTPPAARPAFSTPAN